MKNEIKNKNDLINQLKGKSKLNKVEYLSQYTTANTLVNILNSKHLFLNNPENMNDLYEYRQYKDKIAWDNVYFASFSSGKAENMAMWSMYAQPWGDGIMISFPKKEFVDWINNITQISPAKKEDGKIIFDTKNKKTISKDSIFISKVAYVDDKMDIKYSTSGSINLGNPYSIKELAGYIKDIAWLYESEFRVRLNSKESNKSGYGLEIPESLLSKMIITTGPRIAMSLIERIPSEYKAKLQIEPSIFTNKIGWVYCDSCPKK